MDAAGLARLGLPARNSATVVKTCPGAAAAPKWPLEPARRRWGARNGPLEPSRPRWGARNRPLEPRSASLGRSRWPLEPARLRWGARDGRLSPLGLAGALDMAARARSGSGRNALNAWLCSSLRGALELAGRPRSASLGCSTWLLEPARPRWGARLESAERKRTELNRPSLSRDASLGRVTKVCCTQHRDEHTSCIECTGTH